MLIILLWGNVYFKYVNYLPDNLNSNDIYTYVWLGVSEETVAANDSANSFCIYILMIDDAFVHSFVRSSDHSFNVDFWWCVENLSQFKIIAIGSWHLVKHKVQIQEEIAQIEYADWNQIK